MNRMRFPEVNPVSLLLCSFSLLIIDELSKFERNKIFFFAREGIFLKEVYDIVNGRLAESRSGPESELLFVSRKSTFLASVESISLGEFSRLFSLFPQQSLATFFSSLSLDYDRYKDILCRLNISYHRNNIDAGTSEIFSKLFSDLEFRDRLQVDVSRSRFEIEKYFESAGFLNDDDLAICDVGWRGTIQDNICKILPEKMIYGFYFGLESFINSQPSNSVKSAIGIDRNSKDELSILFRSVGVIEFILGSSIGSVVGYNSSSPVLASTNDTCSSNAEWIQEIVRNEIPSVVDLLVEFDECELRDLFIDAWVNIVTEPEQRLVDSYFSSKHDESFGLGTSIDKSQFIRLKPLFLAAFSRGGSRRLRNYLAPFNWPEGYRKRSGASLPVKLLGIFVLRIANIFRR